MMKETGHYTERGQQSRHHQACSPAGLLYVVQSNTSRCSLNVNYLLKIDFHLFLALMHFIGWSLALERSNSSDFP